MALCRSRQASSVLRSIVFYTKDSQQQPYRKVAGLGKAGSGAFCMPRIQQLELVLFSNNDQTVFFSLHNSIPR